VDRNTNINSYNFVFCLYRREEEGKEGRKRTTFSQAIS